MFIGDYDVRAPLLLGGHENDPEMLGAATWLWMHSPLHRDAPLSSLATLLLPFIKAQQYVLISQQGQPVFYLSWSRFDEETEHHYLTTDDGDNRRLASNRGDRLWIVDWVAPFGHSRVMADLIKHDIFPYQCVRALYHKGSARGAQVRRFRGAGVSREQAAAWWDNHPLTVNLPERRAAR
ncbi:toxin-activating lysine-acyltransferase [Xenorhabdus sp. SGI246]|uniref:toxin-activating lysine-acyltransferase n=1 Tax=Xenorhabdus sp. SGI246 TaxID=3158263 RepID=UPI00349F747F